MISSDMLIIVLPLLGGAQSWTIAQVMRDHIGSFVTAGVRPFREEGEWSLS